MSKAKVVHLDSHQEVQALLPWYVTQRLSGEELVRVVMHLADCPRCQADLDIERKLQAAHLQIATSGDVERGFAKLRARITGHHAPRQRPLTLAQRLRSDWRDGAAWMRWAVVAQFATVPLLAIVLALWLLPPSPADSYRGLGASVTAGSAVVMFKPDATEQDIRRALTRSGARLIGGPTVTGAYVLGLPAGRQHAALTELRTESAVVLAESLDAGSQP